MNNKTVYISPMPDEYTGYSTYIFLGTSTSDLSVFRTSKNYSAIYIGQEEKRDGDVFFPESREERYFNVKLLEFYKKKGYEITK